MTAATVARVLFDEAHSEAWTIRPELAREMQPAHPGDASYAVAAQTLAARDFAVAANVDEPLSGRTLESCDVLVIAHPSDPEWERTTGSGSPRFSDDELAAIRDKASPLLQAAIDLAYLTGLRVSDLLAARWDQFKDDGIIENVKTGVRQRFALTDDLEAVLKAARALQGRISSLYVLCGRGGQPLKRQRVGVWWRKACKAAGVKNAVWHDLRAKAGTDADAAGLNAQNYLGHASAQTTRTYLRGKRILTVVPMPLKRVK